MHKKYNKENINRRLILPSMIIERSLPVNIVSEDAGFYRSEASYKTHDCYIYYLKNVQVSSDSIVFENGHLVSETLYSNDHINYYSTRYLVKKLLTSKRVRLSREKKYLLATDYYSSGHFHWFTEALPRLFCTKDIAPDFVLLLPDVPYIRKIGFKSLELLDINFQDIVWMQEKELYKVPHLCFISKISKSGHMHDSLMKAIRFILLSNKRCASSKIYISRDKAKYRKVLNEKELSSMLKSNGFEILFAEDLSLPDQIDIFSMCQTLIGIHGAGLTNCLFMRPQSKLVELRRNEANVGYWFLADSLEQEYYYYNGIPDSEKSIIGQGCNLTIPINEFENSILKYLQ